VQIVQFGNGTGALRARIKRLLARRMSARRYLPCREPTGRTPFARPRTALASRGPSAVPPRVAERARNDRVYLVTPVSPTPRIRGCFLIDLGYPPPAVSCGWCQRATADILQALQDWLLR
jgi:hypothetical protein